MKTQRPSALFIGAVAATMACAGSEPGVRDARVEQIHNGLIRDSVIRIIARDPSDTRGMVHSRERFLVNGQHWEVLFYDAQGRTESQTVESVELMPIILHEDTVAGLGWSDWDRLASANGLQRTRQSPPAK